MTYESLLNKIEKKEAIIGIIGLGYAGLPLSIIFSKNGFNVLGFDIDSNKIKLLYEKTSYLKHIPSDSFKDFIDSKLLVPTNDFNRLSECNVLIICVPTPLLDSREPDLKFLKETSYVIGKNLKSGQLISLESTSYPGTTNDLIRNILEKRSGLKAGKDFYLIYSPEREDPGNKKYNTSNIPKIIGGYTEECLSLGKKLYSSIVEKIVPVSSTRTAEMVKLFENVYRAVNVALVNELKLLCQKLNIDVWEVLDSAATKPFGFQVFWPGPGLGGHCTPVDPFYLSWSAKHVDMTTRFIELAGEINTAMPYHIVDSVQKALNNLEKPLKNSNILILGIAYKPDIDDLRESPALKIMDLLLKSGSKVSYYDPYIVHLKPTRKYNFNIKSIKLDKKSIENFDCVLITTDHSNVDYEFIAKNAKLIIDTRRCITKKYNNVIMA